jgi:predicted RNA polymerase sigma factor
MEKSADGSGSYRPARSWLVADAGERLTDEPCDQEPLPARDDTLTLLFRCCHPSLSSGSQAALTLRAVGGLSTAEIARAFLTSEATMEQRIARATHRLREADVPFELPPPPERAERLRTVLRVLYLIFNEGYTAGSEPALERGDLAGEAIQLLRRVRRLLPDEGEVAGLLALVLLHDARRSARTGPAGEPIPLAEQDRARWDADLIREGIALITDTLTWAELGPYQLQAAIAAVHAEARDADETDWPQILALYDLLERIAPSPAVTLNRAVARAMVEGPRAALALLESLDADERMAEQHRLHAVRAHLLELAGEAEAARECFQLAARRAPTIPEQHYLEGRASRLPVS